MVGAELAQPCSLQAQHEAHPDTAQGMLRSTVGCGASHSLESSPGLRLMGTNHPQSTLEPFLPASCCSLPSQLSQCSFLVVFQL